LRIDFAEGIGVGDHLPPLRETEPRAIAPLRLRAQVWPVTVIAAERANAGLAEAAADLDVIATRRIELALGDFLVLPERNVGVEAHRAVFVVARTAFQLREVSRHVRTDRVHQVASNLPAGIGKAFRATIGFRVEQDARGLARAGSKNDDAARRLTMFAGRLV